MGIKEAKRLSVTGTQVLFLAYISFESLEL